ncbi:MAG: polysaccharide biosynthesis/export family protein [Bacteroidales bacterium]|nr:polysaccharide biosynthesis/export family protein [Bacteroidales bacterium]
MKLITGAANVKSFHFFLFIIILVLAASSCTPHQKLVFLQHQAEVSDTLMFSKPDYFIKPGDILHIRVLTLDEESDRMFNSEDTRRMGAGSGSSNNISVFLHGYTVEENGTVKMPVLGDVKVAGQTISQATKEIENQIEEYLIGATVVIKLVNFSITVLGEVRRPGNYYIYDNQFSIMDAIGLAGDMTDYGNRQVNIVRQTDQGATFATLDVTDSKAVASEFYYLQPNDMVYVEPHKVKRLGFAQFPFAVVFSAISTTLLLINFFGN